MKIGILGAGNVGGTLGMAWAAKDDVYRFDKLAVEGVEMK